MKIKDLSGNLLLAELTDDISERGGVDHQGETLKEFIELSGLTDHDIGSAPPQYSKLPS